MQDKFLLRYLSLARLKVIDLDQETVLMQGGMDADENTCPPFCLTQINP